MKPPKLVEVFTGENGEVSGGFMHMGTNDNGEAELVGFTPPAHPWGKQMDDLKQMCRLLARDGWTVKHDDEHDILIIEDGVAVFEIQRKSTETRIEEDIDEDRTKVFVAYDVWLNEDALVKGRAWDVIVNTIARRMNEWKLADCMDIVSPSAEPVQGVQP